MKRIFRITAFVLGIVLLAWAVMGSDEQTVTCSWGPGMLTDGQTIGDENEGNTSIVFPVRCDNSAITISSVVVTLSPSAGDLGTSLTLLNATNKSYYEASFEGFPDAGYRVYATANFVNTTNSSAWPENGTSDTINLTSLSSTTTTRNINVDTNEGSVIPAKEKAEAVEAEKKSNTVTLLAIFGVIIIIFAAVYLDKKG